MIRRLFSVLALTAFLSMHPVATFAVQPDEILKDPKLEHRAREISAELRCLVCQNQSIDDSDASLAKDLRVLVRERLQAGDSNQQVMDYVSSRYSDFVLLKPPVKLYTLPLWAASPIVLVLGCVGIYFAARRRRKQAVAPLSPEEKAELDALLKK